MNNQGNSTRGRSFSATWVAGWFAAGFVSYRLFQTFLKNSCNNSTSSEPRWVLITGANKGIGFGIAKYLIENTNNYNVILSGRSQERVDNAIEQLLNSNHIRNGTQSDIKSRLIPLIMDVSDENSVKSAYNELVNSNLNLSLYCIVNNAGISPEIDRDPSIKRDLKTVENIIVTNTFSAVYVTKYFSKLLDCTDGEHGGRDARIVNISSGAGPMNVNEMSSIKKNLILNQIKTLEQLNEFIDQFYTAFCDSSIDTSVTHNNGFKLHCYGFSKACMNCLTCNGILRNEVIDKSCKNGSNNDNILINCCTPGLVDTDMTKHRIFGSKKKQTIEEGIQTPIKLIMGDINGQTERFFGKDCKEYCLDEYVVKR